MPKDNCNFNRYSVLYEGYANRIVNEHYGSDDEAKIIYTLSTKEITFALTQSNHQVLCGYTLFRTQHPKLFIVQLRKDDSFANKGRIAVENLDIFAYVNSKFVYVEKHIYTQINQLYHDVLMQRCTLEQQVLRNSLTIATQLPDEFAYHLMKGPGYMAVVAGEVVHIVKCIPTEIKIRKTKECYLQLPITRGNQSLILSSRTHIIMKGGVQVDCNPIIPLMYRLDESWYRLTPAPIEAMFPTIMNPMTKPTWKYVQPGSLATSGIYTEEDLNNLRDHIMFPAERTAVLNTIARGVSGQPTLHQGISLTNLLDEESLNKIVDSTWNKMWSTFLTFGTASAGILGVFLIARGIKLAIDTIIHGYALHTIYGWSLYLLGSIWDSVTNLLLHLGRQQTSRPRSNLITKSLENQPNNQSTNMVDTPTIVSAPLYPTLENETNRMGGVLLTIR